MFSIHLLSYPKAHSGDLIFFRRLTKAASFESAILEVSDADVFHVAMVVGSEMLIHSIPDKGVCIQSLSSVISQLKPDVIELGIMNVEVGQKESALKFAIQEIGAEYNDLFLSNCINSNGKRSFYCCQLVKFAYESTNENLFLSHCLNFKDKSGQISNFWLDYYQKRGIENVPQDQPGSHPSKIRASPIVSLITLRYYSMGKLMDVPANFLKTLHYVGGAFTSLGSSSSANRFTVYEPRSGNVLTEFNSATKEDVKEVINLASKAQQKWASKSWQERAEVLRNVGRLIRINSNLLAEWEVRDNGKPISEAIADVLSCADTFEYYAGIDLSGQYLPYSGQPDHYAYTERCPFGVVAAIGAWNYPIQTCTWKVAPAIACGNAIIYKPSHFTPVTSVLLAQLLTDAGLPDNVVNILQGGAEVGQALCLSPDVRKVSFTGSVPTGKLIAQNSSIQNVKPVTLELGGKSALIVFEDADLNVSVNGALVANFYSQGQVCTNASKILVHKSIVQSFTELLVKRVNDMKIGDPFDESTHVGASVSSQHIDGVLSFIQDAVKDGAKILCGGERVKVSGLENGFYLSPCVLSNVNKKSRAYTDEIFGPVLLIIPFESEEEALSMANETEFGLAAGVFTKDLKKANVYSSKLNAGNVYVNTFNDTSPFVPFGGFNQSGYGRENGKAAIEYYTQIKSVFVNASNKLENPFGSK